MAGIHGGVQTIIKEKKVIFNGCVCVDFSLNLCSQHSCAETAPCVTFLWNSRLFFFLRCFLLHNIDGMCELTILLRQWKGYQQHAGVLITLQLRKVCGGDWSSSWAARKFGHKTGRFYFRLMSVARAPQEVTLTKPYLQTTGLTLDKVLTKQEAIRLFLHGHLVQHATEQALYLIARFKKRMAGEQVKRCWTHSARRK